MPEAADTPRQLVLDLPVEVRLDAEDFLVGASNEAAFDVLGQWPDWPDPVLLLLGPPGTGKTHCASIWAARSGAAILSRAELREADVPRLARAGALVIEDCDRAFGHEDALFHLLNAGRESGTSMVLTARAPPHEWGLATPDLVSRLRLAPIATLLEPDDGLLGAVLIKLFHERQLAVDTGVVAYLARHIDRSVAAAGAIVAALDREALERGRRITRAMAAELLRRTGRG